MVEKKYSQMMLVKFCRNITPKFDPFPLRWSCWCRFLGRHLAQSKQLCFHLTESSIFAIREPFGAGIIQSVHHIQAFDFCKIEYYMRIRQFACPSNGEGTYMDLSPILIIMYLYSSSTICHCMSKQKSGLLKLAGVSDGSALISFIRSSKKCQT